MGQISFRIILVIPFFILLCLSLFVFYAYDIEIVDGKLNIKSNISKQVKSNLIGQQNPNFFVFFFWDSVLGARWLVSVVGGRWSRWACERAAAPEGVGCVVVARREREGERGGGEGR